VTHTYITFVEQPTLHYLTRSVRRRAASFKSACGSFPENLLIREARLERTSVLAILGKLTALVDSTPSIKGIAAFV